MPFDAQGNFSRVMNWQEDAANDISILASRHDAEDDNFAAGFNDTVCRDGRAAMTGNLKMGSNKITGLADGTNSADGVNKGQLDALNTTLSTAINTAISNAYNTLFPVGSVYMGTGGTCPIAALVPTSTWTLLASKIVIDVSSTVAVKGTGKTLGLTNGTDKVGLSATNQDTNSRIFNTNAYNINVKNTSATDSAHEGCFGVVTDATKSGLTGTATSTTITVNVWERTA